MLVLQWPGCPPSKVMVWGLQGHLSLLLNQQEFGGLRLSWGWD